MEILKNESQFWAYIPFGNSSECWNWSGPLDGAGYGSFTSGYKRVGAHRYMLFRMRGYLLPHEYACHSCDNPRCVNPAHLFAGTASDNNRDMSAKGRARGQALSHCAHGHPYDEKNTYFRAGKVSGRQCRTCNNLAVKRAKMRRKAAAA